MIQVVFLESVSRAIKERRHLCDGVPHQTVAQSFTLRDVEMLGSDDMEVYGCYLAPHAASGRILVKSFDPHSQKLYELFDPARLPVQTLH